MKHSAAVALVAGSFLCAAARADDFAEGLTLEGVLSFNQPAGQPAEQPAAAKPTDGPEVKMTFGQAGSTYWTLGGGVASSLGDDTDFNLYGRYSGFVSDNFEIGFELGAWYFSQKGGDAIGLNPNLLLRWHFYNDGKWTIYGDMGVGLLFVSDDVPPGGTSFDFMPRAGVGFTRLLDDAGTRLEVGLRWHHVSNARITGQDNNPSLDLPMLYFGVEWPF